MSAEMLKSGLMDKKKFSDYMLQQYLGERSAEDIRLDIMNLIVQERKEAVEAAQVNIGIPEAVMQKQRLDEFTKAALSCVSNKDWNDKKNIARDAVQIARATIAELDK